MDKKDIEYIIEQLKRIMRLDELSLRESLVLANAAELLELNINLLANEGRKTMDRARSYIDASNDIEDIRYWAAYLKGASDQYHEDRKGGCGG